MFELVASRAGTPTAVVRGAYLHSKYDPRKEAQRFALQALNAERPSLVVLLGAGLGYLARALQEMVPGLRVMPVFYDASVHDAAVARTASDRGSRQPGAEALAWAWHPQRPTSLLEHLRTEIRELDSEGLAVVEWPTSARLFPEVSREANRAIRQLLRELRGSLATTAVLGRRWLRNAFRNFVFLENLSGGPLPPGAPVLITASGPSLEEALPLVVPHRDRFALWALPSSLLALREQGLRPDLVVLTDPGYYAMAHLHPGAAMGLEIAMPLSAACGTWRVGATVLPLSQGTFFERALCALRGLEPTAIPSFGTVAASALTLARRLAAPQIVVAGLDLTQRDIRSHARPNVFDSFLEKGCGRLSPFFHRSFSRNAEEHGEPGPPAAKSRARAGSTLALDTYAGWFAALEPGPGPLLHRLLPSEVPLPAFASLDGPGFRAYADTLPRAPSESRPPRAPRAPSGPSAAGGPSQGRAALAASLLAQWQRKLRRAARELQTAGVQTVLADPELVALCYYSDAPALAEVHRRLRLDGPRTAAERLHTLLDASAGFLESIRSALEGE